MEGQNFFTETVEMLWISHPSTICNLGFLLRIWRFAQDFVKVQAAAVESSYSIDTNKNIGNVRRGANASVEPR